MKIDARYHGAAIRNFASRMADADPEVRRELEIMFNDDQSDEFYAGLLAGLANAQVLIVKGKFKYLPLIVSFISEKLEKKEII